MPTGNLDLSVDLCGVQLDGPLMLGSGGLGESAGSLALVQESGCAAVVTRTLRDQIPIGRESFPSPHLALGQRRGWLLNCEWGNLQPMDYWIDTGIPEAASRGTVIASVSGRDSGDCARTCERLDNTAVAMIEVNFSCSHAGQMFGRIQDEADHISSVVARSRRATDKPLVVKLGWSPMLEQAAVAAELAGADAITVTNAIGPGLDIDIETGKPRLGISGGFGGMSGPAIFPIALECVSRVLAASSLPVIGVGGISAADDAIKMLMIGAACVQVYTSVLLRGPGIFDRLLAGLESYMLNHGYYRLDDFRGVARAGLAAPSHMSRRLPVVNVDRCQPCGACARVCPTDAIDMAAVASIDESGCIGCGICVDVCPPVFSALSLPDEA